jgi:hypothetical protein
MFALATLDVLIAGLEEARAAFNTPQCLAQLTQDHLTQQQVDLEDRVASCTDFIQLRDIQCIEKDIEAETIQLDPEDVCSIRKWVKILRDKDCLLGFKSKSDPVPSGWNVAQDVFILMVQTPWQQKMFAKYDSGILCIDGTHNTSMYKNLDLTTLVARNNWKHGA